MRKNAEAQRDAKAAEDEFLCPISARFASLRLN
jgi:hypothetical protein